MPLPASLGRFNRHATNRVLGPAAAVLPGFAVVRHVGRRSGRLRRTPVNMFRDGDRYVIPLTYGAGAPWVRNVLAAGGCEVETRGRRLRLRDPEVVRDRSRRLVPAPVRRALAAIRVNDFMLPRAPANAADAGAAEGAGLSARGRP
jgi:deazaflavin-dependent oxidoreductase (nitroreductase family)